MPTSTDIFSGFLSTSSVEASLWVFVAHLAAAGVLAWLLGLMYVRYGRSLSNRRDAASNFLLVAMATMLIISVVKSSIALSLGLVGALSIVRFRAAIKEPEELSYLFLAVAIGLGFGAGHVKITTAGFIMIALVLWLRQCRTKSNDDETMYVNVSGTGTTLVDRVIEVVSSQSCETALRRVDETADHFEVALSVHFDTIEQLKSCKAELRALDNSLQVSILESRRIL